MATYVFTEAWRMPYAREQIADVLLSLEHYPDWWPEIRAVATLGPDDGLVLCRSSLPYTLELTMHAVSRGPEVLEVCVGGDLEGSVRWRLTAIADHDTRMDFHQEVRVTSRLLNIAGRVGRPLLEWNHTRMMRSCRRGLAGVLAARG